MAKITTHYITRSDKKRPFEERLPISLRGANLAVIKRDLPGALRTLEDLFKEAVEPNKDLTSQDVQRAHMGVLEVVADIEQCVINSNGLRESFKTDVAERVEELVGKFSDEIENRLYVERSMPIAAVG